MPHDIATQHQIVGELESEQALVEANRELIDLIANNLGPQ